MHESHSNENRQRLFTQRSLEQGVSRHHRHLADTQRQAGEWGRFRVRKEGPSGGTGNLKVSYLEAVSVIGWGSIFGLLWLVPRYRWGKSREVGSQ